MAANYGRAPCIQLSPVYVCVSLSHSSSPYIMINDPSQVGLGDIWTQYVQTYTYWTIKILKRKTKYMKLYGRYRNSNWLEYYHIFWICTCNAALWYAYGIMVITARSIKNTVVVHYNVSMQKIKNVHVWWYLRYRSICMAIDSKRVWDVFTAGNLSPSI